MESSLCLTALLVLALAASAQEVLPKTLMAQRGRTLASEDFTKPPAPFTGVPAGFASGFSGWRFNNTPKAGRWEVADGVFRGIEQTESHHPATASYGMQFRDAIIQCEVRMDNVPADGRPHRNIFINVTDSKDYLIQVSVGIGGIFLTPFDATRINPNSGQRERGISARASLPVKLDVWHTLTLEIKGEEAVATLDGERSVTVSNPLIGSEKHSIMIGTGTQGCFKNFRVWEALPNAEWPKNKEALQAAANPTLNEVFRTDKLAELDATLGHAIKDGTIIGAALWVERDGVAYHKALGHRALMPVPELMTEDTIFDVASVTKVLATATAAMLCIERGLFKLDDLVAQHLPEFTGQGREKITLRHLLLHTSGMPVNLDPRTHPFTSHEEAITQLCRTSPLFEPGSAFSYSSVGSMVLGAVIEHVTDTRLDAFCTSQVFKPLRMNDTGFRPSGERLSRVSPSSAPERGLTDDTVGRLAGGIEAHASLFTTTADMARFARMLLNQGKLDGVRILKPETVRLMTSVQSPAGLTSPDAKNLPVQRGLGWDINTPYRTPPHDYTLYRGALFPIGGYGHTGWTGQMLWIDPSSRTFVILLCNRYGGSKADTRAAVYQMHHRISTLAAEAVKGFDFKKTSAQSPANSPGTFVNSLGMKFVPLAGTRISMCVHETRRSDYAAYVSANPQTDASWNDTKLDSLSARAEENHPVVNVSWNDAQAFCAWLSQKEGRVYRLPTDREWSLAVGIGDQEPTGTEPEKLSGKIPGVYPWGIVWPPPRNAGNYADADCKTQIPAEKIIAGYTDGFALTSPVMSFPPNAAGIYDLGGSVWEWCEDFYNQKRKDHVLRGASWGSSAPAALLSSFRGNQPSTRRWRCDGFRCVVEVAHGSGR